ncbi:MAG: M4 family metallopeptidase [Bacteroidia bacterium]
MTYSSQLAAQNQRIIDGYLARLSLTMVVFPEGQRPLAAKTVSFLRAYLNAKEKDELRLVKIETDKLGYTHQKYQRYYDGIKVEHDVIKVHSKGNWIYSLNGEWKNIMDTETRPIYTEEDARQIALSYIGAKEYKWEVPAEEAFLRLEKNNPEATYFPHATLVYIDDFRSEDRLGRLAYKFDIYAHRPISRTHLYIDANNGNVLCSDAVLKHANALGTAETHYSGTQPITTDNYNGKYRLRETRGTANVQIQTFNMQQNIVFGDAIDFTDNNNQWTAAEYNNPNQDDAALDVHWGMEKIYDYFLSQHHRNSYNNAGASIKSYVHYGQNYNNAFWDGNRMAFGDGDGSTHKPFTSLDICAHELGHAVCEHSAELVHQKESGAIGESMSDIWAACVENMSSEGKATWLIGEEIELRPNHAALRSMSNPKVEAQPNTYYGDYWETSTNCNTLFPTPCGVNTNSGIMNYWFYLLANGGAGVNDLGNNFMVSGVGISAAAKIAYRSETVYMTPNETFGQARVHTLRAAADLYGENAAQVIAVMNAWYAVGVGSGYVIGGNSCGVSSSLMEKDVTITSATLAWAGVLGAKSYDLRYKLSSDSNWINITNLTASSFTLNSLKENTAYDYQVAAVCTDLAGAYTETRRFVTEVGSSAVCEDAFEDNDALAVAKSLSLSRNVNAKISTDRDVDYFYFSNTAATPNIKVSLTNLPSDFDLKLYTNSGTLVGISENDNFLNEVIAYNNAPVGTYRVKVYGYKGAFHPAYCYHLKAELSDVQFVRGGIEPMVISWGENPAKFVASPQKIVLYPNPSAENTWLNIMATEENDAKLLVFDGLGRVVLQQEISLQKGENGIEINSLPFATGIYTLYVQIGETTLTEKFLKL